MNLFTGSSGDSFLSGSNIGNSFSGCLGKSCTSPIIATTSWASHGILALAFSMFLWFLGELGGLPNCKCGGLVGVLGGGEPPPCKRSKVESSYGLSIIMPKGSSICWKSQCDKITSWRDNREILTVGLNNPWLSSSLLRGKLWTADIWPLNRPYEHVIQRNWLI